MGYRPAIKYFIQMKYQLVKRISICTITLFGVIAFLVFHAKHENNPISKKINATDFTEYPGEWMYNQRAYPNNIINTTAIKNAENQVKQIMENRSQMIGSWDFIGPLNTGGRVTDVAISPENDNHLYITTAVGGVFRTTDLGVTWEPIFDNETKSSIGNIAIAPSNAQRIYVGTGEANASATSGAFFGDGIYRSDDAGDTWVNVGLPNSGHIARIVVDPNNQDRVFTAATGVLYGANNERGIYRTTNGGNNWEQVLFKTDSTAAIDLVMNSQNTDILYASLWERTRKPWQRDYAGLTSAIHRTTDGGNTWEELGALNGLPAPNEQTGRIGLAISESNPNVIYARYTTNPISNTFNGIYKSEDGGDNWSLVTLSEISNVDSSFGWYFGNIRVHPQDPEEVIILGQSIFKTENGGASWQPITGMHVDHHAMEYSRNNTDFLLTGNDGGAYISENGGNTWTQFTNLPITQFYNIEVDNQQPERLYGGTQDNNTIRTTTAGANDWSSIWGGDGFHVNVNPNDNNFIFVEAQFGNLGRSIDGGNSFQSALAGIDGNDRNNWNTPVRLSNFDPQIVYYGTNRLYSSTNAELWTAISPDLTDGQHPSGSLSYGTLTAIASSYNNLNTIYTGSDDGNVNVTFDGGSNWENISNGLPNRYITSIATVPSNNLTAYVTLSGFSDLDYDPHVFKTEDGGQNWIPIAGNLPNIPVNDIVVSPQEDYLILATDLQVWYSANDGLNWNVLGDNLPPTIIRDLKIHEPSNTLYIGTFGRSMYSFDLNTLVLNTAVFENNLDSIAIYPNPANSFFNIQHNITSQGRVELFDVSGKRMATLFKGDLTISENTFDISHLERGLYFVKISYNDTSITKKLILQ